MECLEAQLREYIARNITFSDDFGYDDDTSFLNTGLIDSTGVMELVTYVSEAFQVDVLPMDVTADNFDSISRLAGYIRRKQGALAVA